MENISKNSTFGILRQCFQKKCLVYLYREENIYSECRTSSSPTVDTAGDAVAADERESLLDRLMRESGSVTDVISRPPLIQGVLGAVPKHLNRNTIDIRWGLTQQQAFFHIQFSFVGRKTFLLLLTVSCFSYNILDNIAGSRQGKGYTLGF